MFRLAKKLFRLPLQSNKIPTVQAPWKDMSAAIEVDDFHTLPTTPSPPFPKEYDFSKMKTASPGPKSLELKKELDRTQMASMLYFFVDYGKSVGNYIVDVDGNRYLDIFGQIASLPLGYNHPAMIAAMTDPKNLPMLVQRPALGLLPPAEWGLKLEKTLMSVAPTGLTDVNTMMCGSCSNENAFKAAFIWYQTKMRGGPPTEEDMISCMNNEAPGCPKLSILSFSGGFHGRLMGCMSATHSKPIHKVDIPAFEWPVTDFPQLRYPLHEYEEENAEEEDRCVALAEEAIIKSQKLEPIAAMIIEPIQAEGGDNHASPRFFTLLRNMAATHGVAFIVDEVQTGGGSTGTFWAHEAWGLKNPPDMVSFSKKMQTGGYYSKPEFRPTEGYRIFNTWMGDPSKIVQLEAFLETVENEHLLENTKITGEHLLEGLEDLMHKYPKLISKARGVGTYIAVDFPTPDARDAAIVALRQMGVQSGGCGSVSIRFRPSLVFQPRHSAEFLDIFETVCEKMYT